MSAELRSWQVACIDKAINHYKYYRHFFCQATPGAGKTIMAAELARRLIDLDEIDLVLCFAPSCQVVEGIRKTFTEVINRRMDGYVGAVGDVTTYQGMEYKGESFWSLFNQYRVLAVFDEIHHCAGFDSATGNSWGNTIVSKIRNNARMTLALSGTPWRSDERAIALARYSSDEGRITRDYHYSLSQAVIDRVCRAPRITLVDNHIFKVTRGGGEHGDTTHYNGIAQLLESSPFCFEDVLRDPQVVRYILGLAIERLSSIRERCPQAGGLVVASNVEHAKEIAAVLSSMGESCCIVTTKTGYAQQTINKFRQGHGVWIVAVGMVSEGTDIPRLQVCCYLSRIRTELHYRQVLGRILRRMGSSDDQAWLYVMAEPALFEYSKRISDDLPEDLAVISLADDLVGKVLEDVSDNNALQLVSDAAGDLVTQESEGQEWMSAMSMWTSKTNYMLDASANYRTELLSFF
ncbi:MULTISPECIES: DEAD/DEAH box helicase [Pseudomonas]|nr:MULTISPECIES: DEAD/DEAH box helicase family protein [Pseudomonas]MCX9136033.1 DEAD/DEAH box helicase family protein [Pseudomonas sp. DCB_PUT]MDD1971909.1 DEAD/DEAH box helicase family protein [Pseudomonas putida]MDO1464124.1 DEAD/DEAH box helicase family protein [Pseudomonas putida]MDO1469501.1 DEAD/DEAH box helicase family protein [Pseudomonas putida]MDZ7325194.1 diguanylate cyclase [Pseudomonas sp. SDS3-8]